MSVTGCCGEKRAAFRSAPAPPPRQVARRTTVASAPTQAVVSSPPPTVPQLANGEVTVEYTERSNIRVRGAATGRTYAFSSARAAQRVDQRDAAALVASGFFRFRQGWQH